MKIVLIFVLSLARLYNGEEEQCTIDRRDECQGGDEVSQIPTRYILYDVNPSEGFNLRRDVYMRFAIFLKKLNSHSKEYWYLVLPPWDHLYHWRSEGIGDQSFLPWRHFFNIESLQRFVPVLEMEAFQQEVRDVFDNVYYLQHFEGAFSKNWTWDDRWAFEDCTRDTRWEYKNDEDLYVGTFGGYDNFKARTVQCVSFQGGASLLQNILAISKAKSTVFYHGEIILHDNFGDKTYWECRRSMRFAHPLVEEATSFRNKFLNSDDSRDNTLKPDRWEKANPKRTALGGAFLCAHLRRRDFLYGRSAQVPSIEHACKQMALKLDQLNLTVVFISTDAPDHEVSTIKKLLPNYTVVQYKPDEKLKAKLKDGGVAIVDQIICSHARYFIGTHESTFSFRIQEEREIMGFPTETTFNRFCGEDATCSEPSKWTIVF